jgi:transcription termination factor Rho
VTSRADLQRKAVADLRTIADTLKVQHSGLQKSKLISAILESGDFKAAPNETIAEADMPTSAPKAEADAAAKSGGDKSRNQGQNQNRNRQNQNNNRNQGQGQGQGQGRNRNRNRNRSGGGSGGGGARGGADRGNRGPGGGSTEHDNTRWEDVPDSDLEFKSGMLDIVSEGYGYLRMTGYLAGDDDIFVPLNLVRNNGLRRGDTINGPVRPARSNEKFSAMLRVDTVSGMSIEEARNRPRFDKLTPLFPDVRLRLEDESNRNRVLPRIVDLVSPVGKGQRGLIVSPPKAGKTTVLQEVAKSVQINNPECHLMVVLVDERPEEVTDMQRTVSGEVIYSTFDRPAEEHTQVAELAIERAKRLVEQGQDVVVLLDSITRLARAYNLSAPASGRILSGGVDSQALYPPKRFFGAARNIEEGGSLTILATALVETGSKMDEVIFEEFKGTGNMELKLDRRLADKRIYPAIDVEASGTRREELLLTREELAATWKLRRVLLALESGPALELLMDRLKSTASNGQFLAEIAKNT